MRRDYAMIEKQGGRPTRTQAQEETVEHTCPAKQNARPHSLRRIITLALAILSALTLLLMGLCLWFVRKQNRDRLTGTANAYLQLLAGTLENQLGTTEAYITNEIMNGEELHRLGFAASRTQAYLDGYRVRSGFSGVLAAGGGLMLVLLLGVALLALAAFALVTRYLHRNVIRPAEGLVDAMQRIAGGDLTARVNGDGGSRELQQVKGAFNAMLEQIETLKIEQYEKTLEAERYELAALKMQIRPHFFLNTLKLLYAMAETGDTRQIQELILLLAKHLRAVLDYNKKTTTLREEAELCQNYIELSSVGQQGERACCYADIERGLAELPLPPLALLSLVENSVKYAQQADRPLTVHITARALPLETGRLVHIRLRDNGPGFAPEQLQALNREGESPAGHFGLHNIRRQCALMYGPDFAMTFTNAPDGGAVVEMYIPQPGAQGKETNA